jgi:hypothetical protein
MQGPNREPPRLMTDFQHITCLVAILASFSRPCYGGTSWVYVFQPQQSFAFSEHLSTDCRCQVNNLPTYSLTYYSLTDSTGTYATLFNGWLAPLVTDSCHVRSYVSNIFLFPSTPLPPTCSRLQVVWTSGRRAALHCILIWLRYHLPGRE